MTQPRSNRVLMSTPARREVGRGRVADRVGDFPTFLRHGTALSLPCGRRGVRPAHETPNRVSGLALGRVEEKTCFRCPLDGVNGVVAIVKPSLAHSGTASAFCFPFASQDNER